MTWIELKKRIAFYLFRDVMNSSIQTYLRYNQFPVEGIKELFNIEKDRILRNVDEELEMGNISSNLVDPIYDFYTSMMLYDFSTLALGIARDVYDKIKLHEEETGQTVNKDKLYFLMALLNVNCGNTITSTSYWELTLNEKNRISGGTNTISNIISQMPTQFTSLLASVALRHDENILVRQIRNTGYPFIMDYRTNLNSLSGLSSLSFLSSGIRNVQVNTFFELYPNQINVTKMYGQELINNLCILNETEFKNNSHIQLHIPLLHHRMIGSMIDKISNFNTGIHTILGSSTAPRSGLYANTRLDLSQANFNTNYPNLISDLTNGTLSEDATKAYILYGFHHIRNNGVHVLNPNIVYYNNETLFLQTIGLLFACTSVIRSL